MTKRQNKIDTRQLSIFDVIQEAAATDEKALPGSMDIDRVFREAISLALKASPLSRYQVAARMSELIGQDITKTMLDSWTAESKEQHRFPAIFLPAFCEAVGQCDPMKMLGKPVGVFVLSGPDALRSEIKQLEEDIRRKQRKRRRRIMLLEELEGER